MLVIAHVKYPNSKCWYVKYAGKLGIQETIATRNLSKYVRLLKNDYWPIMKTTRPSHLKRFKNFQKSDNI